MREITVDVPDSGLVARALLTEKLQQLRRRGLMDAGLVLVRVAMLRGYLAEGGSNLGWRQFGQLP